MKYNTFIFDLVLYLASLIFVVSPITLGVYYATLDTNLFIASFAALSLYFLRALLELEVHTENLKNVNPAKLSEVTKADVQIGASAGMLIGSVGAAISIIILTQMDAITKVFIGIGTFGGFVMIGMQLMGMIAYRKKAIMAEAQKKAFEAMVSGSLTSGDPNQTYTG